MRKLIAFPILVCLLPAITLSVRAQESDRLGVDVRTLDNEQVCVMTEGMYHSCVPLVFTPGGENNFYSISVDDGTNYGAYVKMDTESVTLYPEDTTSETGRWLIRFKSGEGENERLSDVYKICFDTASPVITLTDPEKISGPLSDDETVTLLISDDHGIGRVISRSGGEVISEMHRTEGEEIKELSMTLDLAHTGEDVNTVETVCYDLAGNSSVMTFEYRFDVSAPSLFVEGVSDGDVTASSAKIGIAAKDKEGDAFISYVLTRETGDEVITRSVENLCNETTIDLDDDGEYTLLVSASDRAGNRSDDVRKHFRIDKTPPVLSVSGTGEGADRREAKTISFDVTDESVGDTVVNITLKRSAMGITDVIPLGTYTTQGIHDHREVNINSDGDYELTLSAKDGAGNESEVTKRFRMDTNAPDISISGINEGEVTGSRPVIRFCAGEMFYDSTIMTTRLEKKEKGGYRLISKSDHVMRDVHDHVDVTADSEGVYRLTCKASDRSGNSKEDAVSFTVDYTPPVISGLSDIDNRFFKSFSLTGKIADLVKDATAVISSAYVNDIPFSDDETIIREGKYVLTILAKDEADNESEGSAVFIVDHTSPQIVLNGFDKNGNIRKGSTAKVSLADAADRLVSVRFNGKDIATAPDGSAYITADENGSCRLEIIAEDDAGNVTDTDIYTECYMNAFLPDNIIKEEKELRSSAAIGDENAIDPIGLMVGMLSVLSGSFGFVYRTFLRD